jgi:hypothetical protein
MTVRNAGTSAEFQQRINESVSGDSIRLLDDGVFDTLLTVPSKNNITIFGQTPRLPKIPRIWVGASTNITLDGFKIQMVGNPQPYAQYSSRRKGDLISLQYNTDGLIINNVHARGGLYEDNYAPIDVTDATKYRTYVGNTATNQQPVIEGYRSDGAGGQEPYHRGFGCYPRMIGCMSTAEALAGSITGSMWVENCLFEDGGDCIKFSHNGNANIVFRKNIMQRFYQDFISFGFNGGAFPRVPLIEITGNIFWDSFAQPQDYFNPHGDCVQIFSRDVGGYKLWLSGVTGTIPTSNGVVGYTDSTGKANGANIYVVGPGQAYVLIAPSNVPTASAATFLNSSGATVATATITKAEQITPGPTDSTTPIENLIIAGNITGMQPNARGQHQRFFLSDVPPGAPHLGVIIADNLALSRVSSTACIISNDGYTGAAGCVIFRNAFLANPISNVAKDNEQVTNPITGVTAANVSGSRISVTSDPFYPGRSYAGYNIAESVSSGKSLDANTAPNIQVLTGTPQTLDAYSQVYNTPADWNLVDTPAKLVETFVPKAQYANYGPVRFGDTLSTFLARWSGTVKPYSELPAFVGFAHKVGLPVNTADQRSDFHFVNCGRQTRSISITGGEYRLSSDKNGTTILQDWTSAPGNVTHGNFIQLRTTTAVTPATSKLVTVTVGSDSFSWKATTIDPIGFPLVNFDGTNYLAQNVSGGLAPGVQSKLLTIAMVVSSTVALNGTKDVRITGGASSSSHQFNCTVTSTGKLRFYAPGTRMDVLNVLDGQPHHILITIDTSQPTNALGVRLAVDFQRVDPDFTGSTWRPDEIADWTNVDVAGTLTICPPQTIGGGTGDKFVGGIGLYALWPGKWIDLDVQENIDLFRAANLGPRGEGPFGEPAPIFITGAAADFNNSIAQRGTTSPNNWIKGGTNPFTNATGNTSVWPPNLYMSMEKLTQGVHYGYQPVEILVQPIGTSKSLDVIPVSDKAGFWEVNPAPMPVGRDGVVLRFTPTAPGVHNISITNTGGYFNPTGLSFTAIDNYVDIPAGSTVTITRSRAESLRVIAAAQNLDVDLPDIQVRATDGSGSGYNINPVNSFKPVTKALPLTAKTNLNLDLSTCPTGNLITINVPADAPYTVRFEQP